MKTSVSLRCLLLCQMFILSLQDYSAEYYEARFGAKANNAEFEVCKTMNFTKIGNLFISERGERFRFRPAHECCQHHGLQLLSDPKLLKTMPHWQEIKDAGDNGEHFSLPLVSATSPFHDSVFFWGSGELMPIISGVPPWGTEYPDFKHGTESCVHYVNIDGDPRLNNFHCPSHKVRFVCEAPPPARGEPPTPEDKSFCESVQYESLGNGYTIQTSAGLVNQQTAAYCCAKKGSTLLSAANLREDMVKLLTQRINLTDMYWTSGNNLAEKDVYRWGTDDIIPDSDPLWGELKGPQTFFPNRNCLALTTIYNPLNFHQISCSAKLRILCEADVNICCKDAIDEYVLEGRPGESTFYFEPSNSSLHHKFELVASILGHLSPSQYTGVNWEDIIEKNYIKTTCGQEAKPESVGSGSEQNNECPPKRKVWRKYTAKCGENKAIYYQGPEYANETDPICKNSKDTKCQDFCDATDKWVLHVVIKTLDVLKEDMARNTGVEQCPLTQFKPAIAKNDYTYIQIENAVKNQLSPSPETGINYKTYFEKFYAGETKSEHSWISKDVPENHFMNIYQAVFRCGEHKAAVNKFRMVMFKVGDFTGNCKLAKENNVPLEDDEVCKI